ncbi:MAG: histidine phosphatase family protein [Chloroflexota bacterium]|nr:MAG: histidine phosphatase family protein [Chloroflexota bacterium]
MHLLLVRHAESVGNIEKRWQGHADFPLTAKGLSQAECAARRLSTVAVSAIYSSPSSRALETARIIGARHGIQPQAEDGLREYDVGTLSGELIRDIEDQYPRVYQRMVGIYDEGTDVAGEEGQPAFRARVHAAMWRIIQAHPGRQVVVVSHRGPFATFLLDWLELKPTKRPPFEFSNASLSILQVEGPAFLTIQVLNDTCHLPPELVSERLL